MSENIRNLNMEGATLLDLVAMDVLGALVQSDWGGRLPPEQQNNATQIMVHVDRKSTRLNSSHIPLSRMPSSA